VILCDGDNITSEHIALNPQLDVESVPMEGTLEDAAKAAVKIVETRRIEGALKETRGNKTKAAELLHVSYKTLLTKIKEYGMES
jgi:DNA-binding NtrC family response regulator